MKVIVNSAAEFLSEHEDGFLPDDEAVIVCSSDYATQKRFELYPDGGKLVLSFDDVDNPSRRNAFTPGMAKSIRDFVLKTNAARLYICCDSGESRSTAAAAAIERCLSPRGRRYATSICVEEKHIWRNPHYHPNKLVYRLVCEAFSAKTTALGLYLRERESRNALKNAIKSARKR